MLRLAVALHVVSTTLTVVMRAALPGGRIIDVGHLLLPRARGRWLENTVHIATLTAPLLGIRLPTPASVRDSVVRDALGAFLLLSVMRSACIVATVLPPLSYVRPTGPLSFLLGTDTDFIFSGHAAFVATWALALVRHKVVAPSSAAMACLAHGMGTIASRMHYTVDVLLAWFLAFFVASALQDPPPRRAPPPPQGKPRMYLVEGSDPSVEAAVRELRSNAFGVDAAAVNDDLPGSLRVIVDDPVEGVVGCIAVTPPTAPRFGIDAYVPREAWEDGVAWEVRSLVVAPHVRGEGLGSALMVAALRLVESGGGGHIVAMAKSPLVAMYTRFGFIPVTTTTAKGPGGEGYTILHASVADVRTRIGPTVEARALAAIDWLLPCQLRPPVACPHGGARPLAQLADGVRADVLDAWFPPTPLAVDALSKRLPWAMRTSPPPGCEDVVKAIASSRGVPLASIVVGAGSSDLMYRCLPMWMGPTSRAFLHAPLYGEYAHILEHVVGCTVDKGADVAAAASSGDYDLVVVVNPNSPTGIHDPHLAAKLAAVHPLTTVWVDETYVDFDADAQSLEAFAAASDKRVVVCKSMSKFYALSGCRVAYVCGPPRLVEEVRGRTPPWVVSLPAQLAAIAAMQDPEYYRARRDDTARLRAGLEVGLLSLGLRPLGGARANFLTCVCPIKASDMVARCAARGVFIRDVTEDFGTFSFATSIVRIAVRSEEENALVLEAVGAAVVDG